MDNYLESVKGILIQVREEVKKLKRKEEGREKNIEKKEQQQQQRSTERKIHDHAKSFVGVNVNWT